MPRLVLGSRGSALALAQVRLVQDALLRAHPGLEIEVKIITTSGDRRQDVRAGEGSAAGLKGLFTKEIQDALLDGSIDAAIHSLKDLPGITPPELGIAAVLPRADTSDLLISPIHASLAALPSGASVGTGSVRRRRQLLFHRPDLVIVELRGNVPTRLQKLVTQSLDAIVLAKAGLDRLGYAVTGQRLQCEAGHFNAAKLPILPAIGQGAVGIECRRDRDTGSLIASIDNTPTHLCIRVERELLRLLEGDCRLPVAALAELSPLQSLSPAGDSMSLESNPADNELDARAIVFPEDESRPPSEARATGPANDPEKLGRTLFQQLSIQ